MFEISALKFCDQNQNLTWDWLLFGFFLIVTVIVCGYSVTLHICGPVANLCALVRELKIHSPSFFLSLLFFIMSISLIDQLNGLGNSEFSIIIISAWHFYGRNFRKSFNILIIILYFRSCFNITRNEVKKKNIKLSDN